MADVARPEQDYVLGTTEAEAERLGIQHDAWSGIAHACWKQAGIGPGQHVVDVGAGPGHAARDLARLVGPHGSVTAIERSARFVQLGQARSAQAGLDNIRFLEADVIADSLPTLRCDAVWCRWVASFVESPAMLVDRIAGMVRPGGRVLFHEYGAYRTWRHWPARPALEEYVDRVMAAWRHSGGDPDVAMGLPRLCERHGLTVELTEPRIYCVGPTHQLWRWISTFVQSNLERMVALGEGDSEWAERVRRDLSAAEDAPESRLITPMVLEIVARRGY